MQSIVKSYFSDITSPESNCYTVIGAAPDKPCIFPFIYDGVTYNECIWHKHETHFDGDHWCSTKVNETGKFRIIPTNRVGRKLTNKSKNFKNFLSGIQYRSSYQWFLGNLRSKMSPYYSLGKTWKMSHWWYDAFVRQQKMLSFVWTRTLYRWWMVCFEHCN